MNKDKDIDIRDFFKLKSIGPPDYILSPKHYIRGNNKIEGGVKPYKHKFDSKKEFIWYINQLTNELLKR